MRKFFVIFLCFVIKIYRACISPLFPRCCRYYPTCSQYAMDSIKKYGSLKGSYLAGKRILKCNPFFKGGYDPVP
ncbi:membrane protein insertion efficiency factor YidD [Treponema pectinovorum]|uniref:membrane protein insertion efficiency factor YidD n=1 Tax=Treponema pectinovorum TaxID=164 RepID=UPI0011CA85DB|nr:membrane protein insertion efficiency factor YidD [Treponema pectinovorum]